jgi:hypothetical protein
LSLPLGSNSSSDSESCFSATFTLILDRIALTFVDICPELWHHDQSLTSSGEQVRRQICLRPDYLRPLRWTRPGRAHIRCDLPSVSTFCRAIDDGGNAVVESRRSHPRQDCPSPRTAGLRLGSGVRAG